MPAAEGDGRLAQDKSCLGGLSFQGELEVAHCTFDAVNHQFGHPSTQKIKREGELQGDKPKQQVFLDGGAITVKDGEMNVKCDVSNENFGLQCVAT